MNIDYNDLEVKVWKVGDSFFNFQRDFRYREFNLYMVDQVLVGRALDLGSAGTNLLL